MKKNFLSTIIETKKAYLQKQKLNLPLKELKEKIAKIEYSHRSFKDALKKSSGVSLIAELKHASPSKGILRNDFDPFVISGIYQDSGVDALSVLTEEDYFKGKSSYISKIKQMTRLPILRKDFIIDQYQVYESFSLGADAILLIAAILSIDELKQFLTIADKLDLECLMEVHNEDDLSKVLDTNAKIIGINNRNLDTLEVDLNITERLICSIPKEKIIVSESGIKTKTDVLRLKDLGIDALLMGEVFMSAKDIRAKVGEVLEWLG